jgi:hypothetical protein
MEEMGVRVEERMGQINSFRPVIAASPAVKPAPPSNDREQRKPPKEPSKKPLPQQGEIEGDGKGEADDGAAHVDIKA